MAQISEYINSGFPKEISLEAISYELAPGKFQDRQLVSGATVDSPTSKDLDDAIFLKRRGQNYLVQVSIADVTALIPPNSLVFREALQRVETRYLRNKNIPMLPGILSENRLSLLENEIRPALTFEIEISPECAIENVMVWETLFHSRRRLSYARFDRIIASSKNDPDYDMLVECSNLAQLLLDQRRQKGALAIYDLKRRIFTTEEGIILPLSDERAHQANIVVQEFMILTNRAVAHLFAEKGIPLLYRNHTVKQNTPGREEIIAQFNFALLNPHLLGALSRRSGLWFNKATYDPVLKGHFGLNEAAYTHVTSPIRRIADLINHYQIKAYLSGQEMLFTHDDLLKFSESINHKLLQIRSEKSEYFKDNAREKIRFRLGHNTVDELVAMKSNEFKQLLKEAALQNVMNDLLEQALLKRFESDRIDASHLHIILFNSGEDERWQNIRQKALEFARENAGYSSQVLNLEIQNGRLDRYETEIVESQNGFLARVIGVLEGEEFSTPLYAAGSNKKEAQHTASYDFLAGLLANALVPVTQTGAPAAPIPQADGPPPVVIEENYVGKLTEICSGKADWPMPTYQFSSSGPAHQPLITCKCALQTPLRTLKASAQASSKKIAKQLASKNVLDMIMEQGLHTSEPATAPTPAAPVQAQYEAERNYIGLLQELCQKNKWGMPACQYTQSGAPHQPVFTCILTFETEEGVQEFKGLAASKKGARQIASYNCLRYLYERQERSAG